MFITTTGEYPGTNRFEISGRKGKLIVENDELIWYKTKDLENYIKTSQNGFGNPECQKIIVETDGENLQHIGICRNFTNAILKKEKLFVDGTEGINGVELMDAMLLSTWLGKEVWGTGHVKLIGDFYRKVQSGEKFAIDFYEAQKVVKLILAMYSSNGKEIQIQ